MWKQYNYIEHSIQGMQDFVSKSPLARMAVPI